MSSVVLKWIANGVIGLVVACTMWIAQSVQPSRHAVLVAAAVAAPAAGASAPTAH